jgi:LPS sulfotransferase NodH
LGTCLVVVTSPASVPARPSVPVDAYFVCATPRTGSSLLIGLLDSTGVAGHPQPYFREDDEELWAERWRLTRTTQGGYDPGAFVRAARAAGSSGNGVFGAKLMWGALDELAGKIAAFSPDLAGRADQRALLERAFGRTRFVYLHRADTVAQAVSWLRAEQTGTWYVGGHGEISGQARTGRQEAYDRDRIGGIVRMIEEHNAGWEQWFTAHGIRPHRLRYEDLRADTAAATRTLLDFLGLSLPPGRTPTTYYQRQADDVSAAWIARYRADHD